MVRKLSNEQKKYVVVDNQASSMQLPNFSQMFRKKQIICCFEADLELHLKINNAEIPKVTATKFLVIIIDLTGSITSNL